MSTAEEILESVKNGSLSINDAQLKLSQLKIVDLKKTTYKVSPKGGISFYGIRRMPITLYLDELNQIIEVTNTKDFKDFVSSNTDSLSSKEKNKAK